MSRSVDKVEGIFFAIYYVFHLNGMALDSDTALAFEVHVVEYLGFHVLGLYGAGIFQQAVGEGGFAMVDMGYDTEIAYMFHSDVVI